MKKALLLLAAMAAVNLSTAQVELLSNGSFEDGTAAPWTIDAVNGVDAGPFTCNENWRIQSDSVDLCCCLTDILPSDGAFAAFTSFDSNIDNTEWILEQVVSIPSTIVAATFSFDFTAEFDFSLGSPITAPRELRIDVYRMDGTPLSNIWTDTFIGSGLLSVNYSESIDVSGLLSGVEGMDARIRVTAIIPEPGTGPGKTMIDNMSFIVDDGLNVDEFDLENDLTISPNPSQGEFTLDYQGREQLQSAIIYDITGKQVASFDLSGSAGPKALSANLPSGMYLLQVVSDSSSATRKLIIR